MTLAEIRERADRAFDYFLQTMPDIPFGSDDIVFDFAPPNRMYGRYVRLCEEYRPRQVILPEFYEQLNNGTAGQAIIGKDKSAVLICTQQPFLKAKLRRIIFHELMHIYCAKTEIDGEHFIDIYGSGKPYDEDDEILRDGYHIWTEFIADYCADKYTQSGRLTFESCRNDILKCLDEVVIAPKDNRRDFEWACLTLLNVYEAESVINRLTEPGTIFSGDSERANNTRRLFNDCVQLLHRQLQAEKPWKITTDFIAELGDSYHNFESCHTFFRHEQGAYPYINNQL